MDGRLNSSKSNKLPEWDLYFASLAENQYILYELWRFSGSVSCDLSFDEGSEGFYLAAEK